MTELQSIRMAALEEKLSHRGTVTVGTTPTVSEIVTVPLVKRIREAHPSLQFAYNRHSPATFWIGSNATNLTSPYSTILSHNIRYASFL